MIKGNNFCLIKQNLYFIFNTKNIKIIKKIYLVFVLGFDRDSRKYNKPGKPYD
jgi:hypothetical protein